MPGLDTSMYGNQQQPAVINPLDMFGKAVDISNALIQNRILGAKASAGQAIMNSIDPATGLPIAAKLRTNDPYAAAEVAHTAMDMAQKQFDLSKAQVGTAYSSLGPLATSAAPVSYGDFVSTLTDQLKLGLINPNEYQTLVRGAPTDPAQLKPYVQGLYTRGLTPETLINPVQTGVVPLGQPNAGAPIVGTTADRLKMMTNADGSQQAPQDVQGGDIGSGGADLSSAAPPAATGAPTAAVTLPQGAPSAPSAPHAPGVAIGLGPGVSEAMAAAQGENVKQGQTLQQAADQVPTQKATLNEMLVNAKLFTSGPAADQINHLKALGNQLGITNFDPQGVAGKEAFDKFAKTMALAQTQALGGVGTDEKLLTALGANPNSSLSNLGIEQIGHLLLGNADAIAAKNLAWQDYQQTHGPGSYNTFSTGFNQSFDPRAFQAAHMAPAERASLIQSIKSPADRAKFAASLRMGMQQGIIQMPGANDGGQ